ncbi:MAG: TIGR01777 family oxidoreductase [Acidimicrobiia bacterium]|nr:TIGR01777 family oxidoreductase [Acidimicrobiia bacterium]
MRIAVTGSSGLIGSHLVPRLEATGHDVVAYVRRDPGEGEALWDPHRNAIDPLDDFDAVIHLAGAGIGDKRWTSARKSAIRSSRIKGTDLVARAVAAAPNRPMLLSSSAIGYYGDRGSDVLEEPEPPGDDFLARVCVEWEAATEPAAEAGARVVCLRTGIVLDEDGGALGRMLMPFKFGLGGRLGAGDQWWSWITVIDTVRAIEHLLTSQLEGAVNLTAPEPVTNVEYTRILGDVLERPTVIPTPRLALNALLGKQLAEALLFTSARVIPSRLAEDGFEFSHPELPEALDALLNQAAR